MVYPQQWSAYYDSAGTYWDKDWEKTISFLNKAEVSAKMDYGIYHEIYTLILNDLAIAHWRIQDLAAAEKYFLQSIELKNILSKEAGGADLTTSQLNLAQFYLSNNNFQKSDAIYHAIIASKVPAGQKALAYLGLSEISSMAGDHPKSIAFLDTAMKNTRNLQDKYEIYLKLSQAHRKNNNYEAPLEFLPPIIQEAQLQYLKDKGQYLRTYTGIMEEYALVLLEVGELGRVEGYLLDAYKERQLINDKSLLSQSLNNLASYYQKLGNNKKAISYLKGALELCGVESSNCYNIKNNLASLYLSEGKVKSALKIFLEVANYYAKYSKHDEGYFKSINNLALAYRKSNNFDQSSRILDSTLTLPALKDYPLTESILQNNLAVLKLKMQSPEEALTLFLKAYKTQKNIYGKGSFLLKPLENDIGVAYLQLQDYHHSMEFFESALEKDLRSIRYIFPTLTENEKYDFYQTLKNDFERFNSVVVDFANDNPKFIIKMFEKQLLIKGLFFQSNNNLHEKILASDDAELLSHYQNLMGLRAQLGLWYQSEAIEGQESVLLLEDQIYKEEKVLLERLYQGNSTGLAYVDWKNIQTSLGNSEAVVEVIRFRKYDSNVNPAVVQELPGISYGFTDSIYYAAIITTSQTNEAPILVTMKEGINMEGRFLTYYKNAVNFGIENENSYEYLWKPFVPHLKNIKKIYFSGDGIYHQINLGILKDPSDGSFIIDKYDIHRITNPNAILEDNPFSFKKKSALLISDPALGTGSYFKKLPYTREEAQNISNILFSKDWDVTAFSGAEAKEKVIKEAQSPSIIHIASHGFFSDDYVKVNDLYSSNPLFKSGLVLAQNSTSPEIKNDGYLTAYEVNNMLLPETDLVVLSACETGLGKVVNGEGVYGLQRSFLSAGARNVAISLWEVDDKSTQILMESFYRFLMEDNTPREALKKAQLEFKSQNEDPRLWGAFIIVGD